MGSYVPASHAFPRGRAFGSILRKMILLSLSVMLILAASSCRPDRPWAHAKIGPVNIETCFNADRF
jgi:hypothetical protein